MDALDPDDPIDRLVSPKTCHNLSTANHKPIPDDLNEAARTLLYRCIMTGYLDTQFVTPEILPHPETRIQTVAGAKLEEKNIWYYLEAEGSQSVGINLFNATSTPISWVIVGFAPQPCPASAEDRTFTLKLHLPQNLAPQDHAVLQWDMPERKPISEGCLDILSAGYTWESTK